MSDAIDLTTARLGSRDSIDVRAWPIITTITRLTIHGDGRRMAVIPEFAQAKAWPRVPNVEGGPINWTLWMGHHVGGAWSVLAICTCVDDDYVPTGPVLQSGHIPSNLYYYADAPLASYQPAAGEATLFFLTSGCTRRANTQGMPQPGRSQVVRVPLQAGTWAFTDVEPVPPATPPPVIVPPPAPPDASWKEAYLKLSRAVDDATTAIRQLQDRADARAEAYNALETDLRAQQATLAAKLDALRVPTKTKATSARVFGRTVPIPSVGLE